MKRLTAMIVFTTFMLSVSGCKGHESHNIRDDYPATVMINGENYYSTDTSVSIEVDESMIKYTTSYAEDGIPKKDGEDNFNRNAKTPYAVLEDGMVVVRIGNEWIEFKAK